MKLSLCLLTVAIPALPLVSACSDDPVSSTPPSYFRATLSGAVAGAYEGAGWFHAGGNTAGPAESFSISSTGSGPDAQESFLIYRSGGGRLSRGTYPLQALDPADGGTSGVTATYTRVAAGLTEAFAASTGEVEITLSTPERVEGRFRMSGFRYCARAATGSSTAGPVGPCSVPAAPIADAPTVEVSGSFVARPLNPDSGPASWR